MLNTTAILPINPTWTAKYNTRQLECHRKGTGCYKFQVKDFVLQPNIIQPRPEQQKGEEVHKQGGLDER